MTAQAIAPTTEDELRQAFHAMRNRNSLRHWPADFDAAMADHLRARCIAIEASAMRRTRNRPSKPTWAPQEIAKGLAYQRRWAPCTPTSKTTAIDCKRAAAGDRDD